MEKLREVRDQTEEKIRDPDRVRVQFDSFHDVVSLNNTLRQDEKTVELFKWLHEEDADDAKRVYPIAKSALIKKEEFEICGQFIDLETDIATIGNSYTMGLTMAANFGEQHQDFVEKSFVNEAAILVGILVKTERKDEAQTASAALKKLVTDKTLTTKLEKALKSALDGKIPAPWPQ